MAETSSDLNKRRQCKFIPDWILRTNFSAWLIPVEQDPHKAFCLYCKKVFPVSHGGLHDVKAHAKGKRHHLLAKQYLDTETPRISYQWHPFTSKSPIFESSSIDVSVNTSNIPTDIFHTSDMTSRHINSVQSGQQFCLRWKYHHSNLQLMFSQLLERESFCDVTLACEGRHIRAHKVMLSACSTYFDAILSQHNENNPIVVFKDVRFEDLKALVQFMYKGEIKIDNSQLTPLLKTAEELRIKGLAEVSWQGNQQTPSNARDEEVEDEEEEEEMCEPVAKRARLQNTPWIQPSGIMSSPNTIKPEPRILSEDEDIEILEPHPRHPPTPRETHPSQPGPLPQPNLPESNPNDDESDVDRDLNEEDDELPMPIAPETVYDSPDEDPMPVHEERNIFSEEEEECEEERDRGVKREKGKDVNGNEEEEEEEFEMPGMPAHLTNSAFSSFMEDEEFNKTNTSSEEKSIDYSKYSYVVKMNEFLDQGGRRPQFWEEASTRRVMEAIKNKELEMKQGAEIMGVSYGTLYGRYRDAYGCLKHPYRVKEFWSDQGPTEILSKLRRKELSLFRAAELLNVTVTTLANYIATPGHPASDPLEGEWGPEPPPRWGPKPLGGLELAPEIAAGSPDGN